MASSRKIGDFSSYQDFILFLTTSPQQLHGAHRAPRMTACLRAQAASMTMPRRAAAARASDRCVHGGPAGAQQGAAAVAACICMALDAVMAAAGCRSVDFCNRRARFTQAARKSVWPLSPFWSVSYGAVPIWRAQGTLWDPPNPMS